MTDNSKLRLNTGVTTYQPELTTEVIDQWRTMRDADAGNTRIHVQEDLYLPIPGGFKSQWSNGGAGMYASYLYRAQFPTIIGPAVNSMVGIVHKTEWKIDLPDSMQYLFNSATADGASLESFSRRITREVLLMGRYVIGADSPVNGGDPYLVGNMAETLINWDTNFFVFNESGYVREGFEWTENIQYRIHELDDSGNYIQYTVDQTGAIDKENAVAPVMASNKAMDYVPIVVVGARDISQDVEEPPLMGAADASLAIYRLDADYRHQLYMSGQETLVIDNGDTPEAIGPAVVIEVHSTTEQPALLYYVSPTCAGIAAHKEAIHDEWENAAKAGAKLFDSGAAVESGEARRMRQNAESATLQTIANSSAEGLEIALKNIAIMLGANPDDVVVTPPRNLLDAPLPSIDVVNLVKAYRDGGISWLTLYENLQRGQIASDERDSDDELNLMNTDFINEGEALPQ